MLYELGGRPYVPKPLGFERVENDRGGGALSVGAWEYLDMTSSPKSMNGWIEFGRLLHTMHGHTSPLYGYPFDNTIGMTPQDNTWNEKWAVFYDTNRLGHMFRILEAKGKTFKNEDDVRRICKHVLDRYEDCIHPSIVHGDLWGGNTSFLRGSDVPVIYDGAPYYGHYEVDLAMTKLFGRFPPSFYSQFPEADAGTPIRETIYNLYHLLNHLVLFGGAYGGAVEASMKTIIKHH
eukprot:GHVO01044363.1.p1 GENE.GHVO01044363.1~~GHVO01044363.1.p1  ORF type:complete len:234 (-),score=54.98 GHVO01044363.1:153-854(-)